MASGRKPRRNDRKTRQRRSVGQVLFLTLLPTPRKKKNKTKHEELCKAPSLAGFTYTWPSVLQLILTSALAGR